MGCQIIFTIKSLLFYDFVKFGERSWSGSEVDDQALAHVQILGQKVDIKSPKAIRVEIFTHTRNCPFKKLLGFSFWHLLILSQLFVPIHLESQIG